MTEFQNNRIAFIDIAKGITILCVALYHLDAPGNLGRIFNLFFMPLFFLISGIFVNTKKPFKEFFRSKARRLLGPLLVGLVIGFIIECFFKNFATAKLVIESGFYNFWLVSNVPLWFLLTLFYLMMIVYAVENLLKSDLIKIAVYVILALAGFSLSLMHIKNTLFIGHSLLVIPFFVTGYKFKEYWLSCAWLNWKIVLISAIAALYLYKIETFTNIHQFAFSHFYFPSLIAAFALIILVFTASHFIARYCHSLSNILSWFGVNTIFILILHDLFVPGIKQLGEFIIQWSTLPWSEKLTTDIYNCIVTIPLCVLCIFLGRILKRLLPSLF
ncbi:MAG: acyltransferase family protein [Marinilabiliaceae bacterium]|nr:acyltransferase family protein [Marinilabiliaceae bacterium]